MPQTIHSKLYIFCFQIKFSAYPNFGNGRVFSVLGPPPPSSVKPPVPFCMRGWGGAVSDRLFRCYKRNVLVAPMPPGFSSSESEWDQTLLFESGAWSSGASLEPHHLFEAVQTVRLSEKPEFVTVACNDTRFVILNDQINL